MSVRFGMAGCLACFAAKWEPRDRAFSRLVDSAPMDSFSRLA